MANGGYSLKSGKFVDEYISEIRIWNLFNNFFSSKSTKNTAYKFILMKSIIVIVSESEVGQIINYHNLFQIFTELYWQLYIERNLRQSRKSQKAIAEKIMDMYADDEIGCRNFSNLDTDTKNRLIKEIQLECKKNVIGAVYKDFEGYIYSFSNDKSELILSEVFFNFIKKYKSILLKLNYLEWIKYMENVNGGVNINKFYYLVN